MSGKKKKPERSKLAQVLDFLSLTYKAGDDQAMYAFVSEHWASSFNAIIACGAPIEEDFTACPQMALFGEAVDRCEEHPYSITQLSAEKLLVRSEVFTAYIPCLGSSSLLRPIPDALQAPVDDRLTEALKKVAVLASVKAETVLEASIQLNSGNALSTNREAILEVWHGFDMPNGMLLPKQAVSVLSKCGKKLIGFGVGLTTLTFYFEDESWMRTQLYQDKWPPIIQHLNQGHSGAFRPVPPQLFDAAKKVGVFSSDGHVYVKDSLISSHPFDRKEEGSSLRLSIGSEHEERIYPIKSLQLIAKFVTQWDEISKVDGTLFLGDNLRGVIHHEYAAAPLDEDIPF